MQKITRVRLVVVVVSLTQNNEQIRKYNEWMIKAIQYNIQVYHSVFAHRTNNNYNINGLCERKKCQIWSLGVCLPDVKAAVSKYAG